MLEVNTHEAKTHLSRLLQRVAAGEEIVISRAGKPLARLVPFRKPNRNRTLGEDKGRFHVPEDFNAPLPDDLVEAFEGKL
jgi:prevent-host-death family protein